jgi:hypothetical protein
MPLSRSERYVIDLLQRRFGVHLTKIQERNKTAPDFTLVRDEQHIFVAELKTTLACKARGLTRSRL